MSASSSATPERDRFDLAEFYGEHRTTLAPPELEAEVRRLADPASARETLHWGRNYLYVADLEGPGGTIETVVKQFRNQGLRARLRRRAGGSKAERSWRTAIHLTAADVATPEPLLWIESKEAEGPSFYVTRRTTDCFELRYLFRALDAGELERRFPQIDPLALFAALGNYLRAMHDAGVWHRDISIGNVLVDSDATRPPAFQIVDLNRARLGVRLGTWRRCRDLSRLPVTWPALRRAFLDGYWGESSPDVSPAALLFRAHVRAFLLKHWLKNHVQTPARAFFRALAPRRAHVHLPAAPEGASSRDKIVWDPLSDQPHQHASAVEKQRNRLADLGRHARAMGHGLSSGGRFWKRYGELRRGLYREPRTWDGVGVALRPWPDDPEAPLRLLEELGTRNVLLRLHPWQERHDDELTLARELHARGYELSFSLPQNRDLVRDPRAWRSGVEAIAAQFVPYGRAFQIGQAVNRSKWGVWTYDEYLGLAASASEVLRAAGAELLLGPAVIDFEVHATAGLLNLPHDGVHFDAAAHLLYVDRRGAPENRQFGFDTLGKVLLLHAITETSRNSEGRSWITEFNWPLWEGPHSPAGKDVAVDEEAQASYLVRYYLLTLGTGLVERVFWWQLIARGYGLVAPEHGRTLRPRPAFAALATLVRELGGSRFVRPLPTPAGTYLYLFECEGRELVVGWRVDGTAEVELPRAAESAVDRDGRELVVSGTSIDLGPSPVYCRLSS